VQEFLATVCLPEEENLPVNWVRGRITILTTMNSKTDAKEELAASFSIFH